MILRYLLPALGGLGLLFALIFTATYGNAEPPKSNQLAVPPSTPFHDTVSGTGLVEASSRNIEVGSHLPGIVEKVLVTEGDAVEAGQVLFRLDSRQAAAEVALREGDLASARARLKAAEVVRDDEKDQLNRVESLKSGRSVTVDQLQRRRFAFRQAEANLAQARAGVESAEAALKVATVALERLSVQAPVTGRVLKIRTRAGEFVSAGGEGPAPVLMGADRPLYLRVQVDENDVWRFDGTARAIAALRSNKDISFPLSVVRVEPYVQPKQSLSGDTRERVDTRVLEVIYELQAPEKPGTPLPYIGQQMDVFIEAKPPANAAKAAESEE
jgi:RND family efflux transporter MFP subunit